MQAQIASFARRESRRIAKGDAADAVELAQKSRGLTAQILQSLSAKDFDAATGSLSRTCKTCHNFYKKS